MHIVSSRGGAAMHWLQVCLNAVLKGLPQACMHCEVDWHAPDEVPLRKAATKKQAMGVVGLAILSLES